MTLVEALDRYLRRTKSRCTGVCSTSLEVGDAEAACEIVRRYRLRWRIEEVFRALKSDGMRLEEIQCMRLSGYSSWPWSAWRRRVERCSWSMRERQPRETDVIDAASLSAAEAIGATLEGKTERQKTPIRRILWPGWPGSLPDLVAGIATINRLAPRPCGPDRGQFESMAAGFTVATTFEHKSNIKKSVASRGGGKLFRLSQPTSLPQPHSQPRPCLGVAATTLR